MARGGRPGKESSDTNAFNVTLKDPAVKRSDDWDFPTAALPILGLGIPVLGGSVVSIGFTLANDLFKIGYGTLNNWKTWAGSFGTHPTNDWKIPDLFTVA